MTAYVAQHAQKGMDVRSEGIVYMHDLDCELYGSKLSYATQSPHNRQFRYIGMISCFLSSCRIFDYRLSPYSDFKNIPSE